MYHSTKSDIIHCIEKDAEAVSHDAKETDTQQQHDCVIQDGGQLIHQLDARGTGTLEQFTQRLFLKHLQVELRKVSLLDLVWDTYRLGHIVWDTYRLGHIVWDTYRLGHIVWDTYGLAHIMWDTYRPMSIKGHTRDERGHGVRLKVGPTMRIPGHGSKFLRYLLSLGGGGSEAAVALRRRVHHHWQKNDC